jgi:hypothetical protein
MQRTVLLVVLIGIIVIYDNRDSWSIPTEILPQQQQQSTISLSGSTPNTITTTQEDANEATSNLELAGDFQLAFREVFGFFDDITTAQVAKTQKYHQIKSPSRLLDLEETPKDPTFYQMNWDPDFSCHVRR